MEIQTFPDHFKIVFKYNALLVSKVKELPDRRFDYDHKFWTVPLRHKEAVEKFALKNHFVWANNKPASEPEFEIPPLPELTIDIPLKREPFPFQRNGIAYNLVHKCVIIADEPGLGKSLQSIATVVAANQFPCLVICPASLKENWKREWEICTGSKYAMILEDNNKKNWHLYYESGLAKVFIVNYESLKKYFVSSIEKVDNQKLRLNHIKFYERINIFKSVILDELHRCKDGSIQQSKIARGITTNKEWVLGLTGTPVVNKPKDLISQLQIIGRLDEFGGYKGFTNRFCAGMREASNLKELNFLLNKHCFYRREKKNVLKDLPDKIRQIAVIDIDNRKEYDVAEKNLIEYLRVWKGATDASIKRSMRGEIMVRIGILKNISARGKLNDLYEYIDDIIESGEKLIVFGYLKETIAAIKQRYASNSVSISGEVAINDRQPSVDKFQDDPDCKLMICNYKSGGVGLNLTAASRIIFLEFPWHSADCDQCEDRAHRIGQKECVQANYLLGKNTIDNYIYQIIERKRSIAKEVTGSTEDIEINFVNEISELMLKDV